LLFIVSLKDPRWQTVAVVLLISAMLLLSQLLWNKGYVMPLASSLLLTIVSFVTLTVINMMTESRQKLSILKRFGEYIPPELVAKMARSPEKYHLENANKELTVLFSDIRSFTTISEGLSPDELSELMNRYLTEMTTVIHHHGGTIDKYMGDAIMAFWGAPDATEQHALLASRAALEMCDRLTELNVEFEARGWPPIKIGVGVNTDTMFVGDMGSKFRKAYTVMGDAVNLGARLESLTKQYGVNCLIGPITAKQLSGSEFTSLHVDLVKVKGKNEPVEIFYLDKVKDDKAHATSTEFLAVYKRQKWQVALDLLAQLQQNKQLNDVLINMYKERIDHFQTFPPGEEWDGVFTYTSK
jgi:adenylate cyclase